METTQPVKTDAGPFPIEDLPVILVDNIISYKKATHEKELTAPACESLMKTGVPVNGRPFVVLPEQWTGIWRRIPDHMVVF